MPVCWISNRDVVAEVGDLGLDSGTERLAK